MEAAQTRLSLHLSNAALLETTCHGSYLPKSDGIFACYISHIFLLHSFIFHTIAFHKDMLYLLILFNCLLLPYAALFAVYPRMSYCI